jgi:hypothetical protein
MRLLPSWMPGRASRLFVVQDSSNFTQWTPIITNTLTNTTVDLVDTNAPSTNRFYRGVAP